jgi:hypothetical protein
MPSSNYSARPLYGPMTNVAPHLNRSASNSDIAPFALNGTQLAQCDVAKIANANSGPLGNTNAMRSPFPNPSECNDGRHGTVRGVLSKMAGFGASRQPRKSSVNLYIRLFCTIAATAGKNVNQTVSVSYRPSSVGTSFRPIFAHPQSHEKMISPEICR